MVTSSNASTRLACISASLLMFLAGYFPCAAATGKPSLPAAKGTAAAPRTGSTMPTPAVPSGQQTGVDKSSLQALVAVPDKINLQGRYTEARVLFDGRAADGTMRDVTSEVALSV